MKWNDKRRSDNVEDNRRGGGIRKAGPIAGVGTIVIVIIMLVMGKDPSEILNFSSQNAQQDQTVQTSPESDKLADMSSVVLASTEDVWHSIFKQNNMNYQEPKLVLFTNETQSACGFAESASGPFYCPGDNKVYLDLGFFQDLNDRFGAPGDFAQAYVIAHEVGHHVQNIRGILNNIHQEEQEQNLSEEERNQNSVRIELQADFYAGVWAHYADKYKDMLEDGDIDEALNAASKIGDDYLQKQAQGYAVPETFTHGTSAQRSKWFKKGYETGDYKLGDQIFTINNP